MTTTWREPEQTGGELALCFANGYIFPLAIRELVARIRHKRTVATLMFLALLLAIGAGDQVLGQIPIWARLVLNIFSVALFLVVFPALLSEAETFAASRGWRRIFEPFVTIPTALLVTLASEALVVFIVGDRVLGQRELAINLAIGVVFWEIVVNILMLNVMPAATKPDRQTGPAPGRRTNPRQIRIGALSIDPAKVLRVESDDHFLILHTEQGPQRVLARFRDADAALRAHGLAVHRSHWVAFTQLGPVARQGRSLIMRTRSGDDVPVARDRRALVEAARSTSAST